MVPIVKQISNYNYSSGNNVKYIVCHFTGNYNDTAKNNADYFGGGDRGASAHYFVDNNEIRQVVEDYNASWHCGDGDGMYGISNFNSIGIEMCGTNGDISEATANNTRDLIKMLMNKYGVTLDRVMRHYDASRKNCPSPYSNNNWARWWDFKKKLASGAQEEEEMKIRTFSKTWYMAQYPDVAKSGIEPYIHYINFGKKEGRLPLPPKPADFTDAGYLICNPDVVEAVNKGDYVSGLDHYYEYGWRENRKWNCSQGAIKPSGELFYRVVAGSFKDKYGAEKKLEELKKAGFDGFIGSFYK
ncbi:peptidoglycan recognition protein family protein [Clostridium cellulovorans]|uniref:N-acetylmuramoyl-L-alanine amidase n=1 Tax=Clostridium cellulovorans (strain ATCC 35296 / DSM 3052 / OCM 3 / 743B) TaxID=573061 RepID=D9SUT2_CLOC7|nr:peptidoglycan recognition family protein [Clostridium cellulovorans]ADL50987.1 N-acetylmuramoyl-L-alanine amidase family 2 [Clostridium cellulovorans 743B]